MNAWPGGTSHLSRHMPGPADSPGEDQDSGPDRAGRAGPYDGSPVTWTPALIEALGPTTDLPTLGSIFGASRWKTYEMARTGEWQAMGVKVVRLGSKYRVIVRSVLEVLGYAAVASARGEFPAPPAAGLDGETRIWPAEVCPEPRSGSAATSR